MTMTEMSKHLTASAIDGGGGSSRLQMQQQLETAKLGLMTAEEIRSTRTHLLRNRGKLKDGNKSKRNK